MWFKSIHTLFTILGRNYQNSLMTWSVAKHHIVYINKCNDVNYYNYNSILGSLQAILTNKSLAVSLIMSGYLVIYLHSCANDKKICTRILDKGIHLICCNNSFIICTSRNNRWCSKMEDFLTNGWLRVLVSIATINASKRGDNVCEKERERGKNSLERERER